MPVQHLPTGIDLYYDTHGAGDPLMLIPATGLPGDVWELQVRTLSQRHQVITFDPRGCGRSTHYKGVYKIEQMACDAIALADRLGLEKVHVFGHSMGGRIGLEMALTYPDRVSSVIMAASGSGVAAFPDRDCVQGLPEDLVIDWASLGVEGEMRKSVFETAVWFTDRFRAEHPDRVQAFFDCIFPQHAKLEELIRLTIARHRWEATDRLRDVSVPVLVVCGDSDTVGRDHVPQADLMARKIPGAEVRVLKGQSHGFFWEEPEETNAWILDWLARHPGPRRPTGRDGLVQPDVGGGHEWTRGRPSPIPGNPELTESVRSTAESEGAP